MYLRKVEGPRVVSLPNGKSMSNADLPPADTTRWVASRKASVVRAVAFGLISREAALKRYALSEDEFRSWENAISNHGVRALRATALQKYRQPIEK